MNSGIRNYLLACGERAKKQRIEGENKIATQQSKCKHVERSTPIHQGNGYYSRHCISCGKDFGYVDRN